MRCRSGCNDRPGCLRQAGMAKHGIMDKNDRPFVFGHVDNVSRDLLEQHAKENLLFMTDAERALWQLLNGKKLGYTFRRQQIIGDYIADFVNLRYKLVIEVVGKYHFRGEQPVSDTVRTADLNRMGYTVVRFTDDEILGNSHRVACQIKDLIKRMEISFPQSSPLQNSKVDPSRPLPSGAVASLPVAGEGQGIVGAGFSSAAWAVDAACPGNPGPMEYRGVDLATGRQLFHYGPVYGTNNIGEFLAIVHALALMDKQGISDKIIYTDSKTAISWVKKKQCKTKLPRTSDTEVLFQVIARAEQWLRAHAVKVPVMKWETRQWGEIPADFGNKR